VPIVQPYREIAIHRRHITARCSAPPNRTISRRMWRSLAWFYEGGNGRPGSNAAYGNPARGQFNLFTHNKFLLCRPRAASDDRGKKSYISFVLVSDFIISCPKNLSPGTATIGRLPAAALESQRAFADRHSAISRLTKPG